MEMEENHHHHACKRSRVGNGSQLAAKISHKEQHQDEDEEDGEGKASGGGGSNTRIMPWQHHPSSRIYRVSRASGGKDRHSKVVTSKGLRDRRVRLSVSTAIQFYDLQDRLGYDQPSKAIEWLIKAAAAAINELPSLDVFLKPPHIGEEDKAIVAEPEADPTYNQQLLSTKSGCSSTSETSKGSVLSLSRSESRVKARERARGRAAKDKEKDREEGSHMVTSSHQNLSPGLNSQTSFTELLTGGGGGSNGAAVTTIATVGANSNTTSIAKQISTADYFSQAGLFAQPQKTNRLPSGFSSPSPYGNSTAMGMVPFSIAAAAAATTGDHPEMQHMQQFSFLHDNLIPVSAVPATGDYNLNFSISSGLAGFNRGTLQSNSPSQLPHHHIHNHNNNMQRLSSVDGANLPFYFGASAVPAGTANNAETQFPAAFDGRLQLCYGDGFRRPDVKGERKS